MNGYKGRYFNQSTNHKFFEGGAHFPYQLLHERLIQLSILLSQEEEDNIDKDSQDEDEVMIMSDRCSNNNNDHRIIEGIESKNKLSFYKHRTQNDYVPNINHYLNNYNKNRIIKLNKNKSMKMIEEDLHCESNSKVFIRSNFFINQPKNDQSSIQQDNMSNNKIPNHIMDNLFNSIHKSSFCDSKRIINDYNSKRMNNSINSNRKEFHSSYKHQQQSLFSNATNQTNPSFIEKSDYSIIINANKHKPITTKIVKRKSSQKFHYLLINTSNINYGNRNNIDTISRNRLGNSHKIKDQNLHFNQSIVDVNKINLLKHKQNKYNAISLNKKMINNFDIINLSSESKDINPKEYKQKNTIMMRNNDNYTIYDNGYLYPLIEENSQNKQMMAITLPKRMNYEQIHKMNTK